MNLNDAQQASRTEHMLLLMTLALRVLSTRFVTIVTLLLNTGVVGWAMYSANWVSLAGATVFAVTSWCLVNLTPSKGDS